MENIICANCEFSNPTGLKYCKACGNSLAFSKPKHSLHRSEVPPPPPQSKPKKKIATIIGLVVGMLTFTLVSLGIQELLLKPVSFEQAMMKAASEINKSCPIMIDQETRLDNTVAMPNNSFQYNYTLVNMAKIDVNIEALQEYLQPIIINNIRTSPDMKLYRENKVTMLYQYKDKNGEFLFKLTFTANTYQ